MSKQLICVILAAGLSKRAQLPKLLQLVQGKPLYHFVLQTNSTISWREVVVVTNEEEIKKKAEYFGYTVLKNESAIEGKSTSIKRACAYLQEKYQQDVPLGVAFFVADQPFITRQTIWRLHNAFVQEKGQFIVQPNYGTEKEPKRGNPVIFPFTLVDELMQLSLDQGGASLIKDKPHQLILINDQEQAKDFDYRADFQSLQ